MNCMGKKRKKQQAGVPGTADKPEGSNIPEAFPKTRFFAIRLLMASAMALTGYLALLAFSDGGGVPGCGPESNCDKVLSSPWAYWLGLPITLPGLGLYGAFFWGTFLVQSPRMEKARRALNLQVLCAFAILAAATWFVGIQAFKIKAFCPFCCSAHALASVATVLFLKQAGVIGKRCSVQLNYKGAALAAMAFVGILGAVQVLFPREQKAPLIVDMSEGPGEMLPPARDEETMVARAPIPTPTVSTEEAPVESLTVSVSSPRLPVMTKPLQIPKSSISLDPAKLGVIGSPDAANRIGVMFDYTCHHCRILHGFVRELLTKYEGKLACMMIPVPLDANCNRNVKRTHRDHVGACEYAKICLAVQQIAPEKYDAFDRWLFSDHTSVKSLEVVRSHVKSMLDEEAFNAAVNGASVAAQLKQNLQAYEVNYKNSGKGSMPQTIVNNDVVFGPPPHLRALEAILLPRLDL
jgi:uncharacterized membrane protein/protein-disulfide isomerase